MSQLFRMIGAEVIATIREFRKIDGIYTILVFAIWDPAHVENKVVENGFLRATGKPGEEYKFQRTKRPALILHVGDALEAVCKFEWNELKPNA